MGRIDPNLRDVLDSLSVKQGVRHPTQDLETLRTIIDRLRPEGEPQDEDILAPDAGAPVTEEDLQGHLPETDEGPEDLASVPSGDEGGVSFDAEPEPEPLPEPEEVRFERVDPSLPAGHGPDPYADAPDEAWADEPEDEDLMEFESMGGAAEPTGPDWAEPALEETDWDVPSDPDWGEDDEAFAAPGRTHAVDETPTETTDRGTPARGGEAPTFELDAQTSEDLAELERQLAELEEDLERLGTAKDDKTRPATEHDDQA